MTIKEALNKGVQELKKENIEEPILKAKLLLAYTLKKNKEYLLINDTRIITNKQKENYYLSINKLCKRVPIQHITKRQEFMKMQFFVDENVLIPRQDTEILVEEIIKICKSSKSFLKKIKILDLCTGSGAIAISLSKYIENSEVTAIDISQKALIIARKNAKNNSVNVKFKKKDLLEELKIKEKYDIIVSNPPYIETNKIKQLQEEVKKEPKIALDGGKDGLVFYKKIINDAYKFLNPDGYLCLEIGYNQKETVTQMINVSQKYNGVYSKKDLNNLDRIIICRRNVCLL